MASSSLKSSRHPIWARTVIIVFLLFSYFAIINFQELFFSYRVNINIVANYTVKICYPRRTLTFGAKRRDKKPEYEFGNFCGVIVTDSGNFEIPASSDVLGLSESRGYLNENLVAGCNYDVTIVGFGGRPAKGNAPRTPANQTITWINNKLGCQ